MYNVCQAQSFCQRSGHSWSLVWQLTCHRTSEPDIFLRSNTCPPPLSLTSIALAEWKIDTHKCDWNIFLDPLVCHWNTSFGHIGMWLPSDTRAARANGLRADLTPLMHGSQCLWLSTIGWILVPTLWGIILGMWNLEILESDIVYSSRNWLLTLTFHEKTCLWNKISMTSSDG